MPNQRAADQTLVAFALSEPLLSELDAVRTSKGLDRSTWIRLAVVEYLQRSGSHIDQSMAYAPDRTRKGGRRPTRYPAPAANAAGAALNETPPPGAGKKKKGSP